MVQQTSLLESLREAPDGGAMLVAISEAEAKVV